MVRLGQRNWIDIPFVVLLTIFWVIVLSFLVKSRGQLVASDPARFEFEVIESFNARYLGDTPGHTGRGGLAGRGGSADHPHVALGDPVYRGDRQVGTVTGLIWERTKPALTIEFDPAPNERVWIGDRCQITIGDGAGRGVR